MKKLTIFVVVILSLSGVLFADIFTSHLKPNATDSLDIGTGALRWNLLEVNDVNMSGTLTGASGNISMWTDDIGYLKADGSVDLTASWTIATRNIVLTAGTLSAANIAAGTPGNPGYLFLLDNTTGSSLRIKALDNAYSASRTLSIDLGNIDRTLIFAGVSGANPTISDWFDQDVKTTASPTFDAITMGVSTVGVQEWGFLDGLDQFVKTTSDPNFANATIGGTLFLGSGSITDSSGDITFGDANLSTTGTLAAGAITGTSLAIAATIDHTLTDDSNDLVISNLNQDKDIIFSVNDGGTQKSFITVDSSKPALMLDPGTVTGILGMIDCAGTFTSGASYIFNFHPVYSGAVGMSGIKVDIDITGTGASNAWGLNVGGNTNASQSSATQNLIGVRNWPTLQSNAQTSNAYGFYFTPAQLILTAAGTKGLYGNYIETPHNVASAGTINQYGVYLKGYGAYTEAGGTINSYAYYSDGGDEIHAGNVRIGDTTDPTVALDVTGQIKVGTASLTTTDPHNVIEVSTAKTGGVTNYADPLIGLNLGLTMNQSGGIIGNMFGMYNFGWLADGDIGDAGHSKSLWGTRSEIEQDAGTTIYGNAYGHQSLVNQDGGTVTGDIYGLHIDVDADGTVTGDTYMLYLNEQTGVDYGIYQNGTALNILGGITRVGTAANYTEISAAGVQTMAGDARVMIGEDIDIAIPKRPAANPPAEGTEDGFPTLDFDDGTDESILVIYHLKHRYASAGAVHLHLDYFVDTAPAADANVVWALEYKKQSHGDNFDFGNGASTLTTTEAVTTGTPANDKKIHETENFNMTTTGWEPHDIILMRIYRDADNTSDNFTGDSRLFHIHIEFLKDKLGEAL